MAPRLRLALDTGPGPTVTFVDRRRDFGAGAVPEAAGFVFSRQDTPEGTARTPRPSSLGTWYSYPKTLHLHVEGPDATAVIGNRALSLGQALTQGLYLFYKDGGDTYSQATDAPAENVGANGAAPSGYAPLLTTSGPVEPWHRAALPAVAGRNGHYVLLVLGVGNDFLGNPDDRVVLPHLRVTFDLD